MVTHIPGPRSQALLAALQHVESRNVTYVDARFPVVWSSAHGVTVVDVDGNDYVDLTAAFGVANVGHSNARVAAALGEQAGTLMHAMGDVHPPEGKVRLLEKLAAISPIAASKTFLASTGAEAVEAALKTAIMATGKSTFVAFQGAYHGLSLGALAVAGVEKFRAPFDAALPYRTLFFPYGDADAVRAAVESRDDVAAVIVEPLQGRGGNVVPPDGFLMSLRRICDERAIVLIFDEIYCGFGRTGSMFACEHEAVIPDILCVGKALGNGFPISAAIARAQIMDAWPSSGGEALHTSTHLGNPMGCAAALAALDEMARLNLVERVRSLGVALGERLERWRSHANVVDVRGRGLMWGVELRDAADADAAVKRALQRGIIVLPAGVAGNVLHITPPLVITENELFAAIDTLERCLS